MASGVLGSPLRFRYPGDATSTRRNAKSGCAIISVLSGGVPPTLVNLVSPYRLIIKPILDYVLEMEAKNPGRQIAVIVDRINLRLTASTLGSTGGSWALSGHALDASDVAGLMTQMQSTGYDSSLTSTEQEGPRLAYAIELDPAVRILKHQRRQFEGDSIVFPLVPKILRFIPFVTHRVYT